MKSIQIKPYLVNRTEIIEIKQVPRRIRLSPSRYPCLIALPPPLLSFPSQHYFQLLTSKVHWAMIWAGKSDYDLTDAWYRAGSQIAHRYCWRPYIYNYFKREVNSWLQGRECVQTRLSGFRSFILSLPCSAP